MKSNAGYLGLLLRSERINPLRFDRSRGLYCWKICESEHYVISPHSQEAMQAWCLKDGDKLHVVCLGASLGMRGNCSEWAVRGGILRSMSSFLFIADCWRLLSLTG